MIEFALAAVLSNTQAHAIQSKEDVNKVCAYIVGIPTHLTISMIANGIDLSYAENL
jgi:hypothetical protein